MSESIRIEIRDGIAIVTLDAQGGKVNLLNREFLQELAQAARELTSGATPTAAVVISSKSGGFIAGADIGQIEAIESADQGARLAAEGQEILQRWADLPFPVVAAIHGHCLGGGTEFALACSARIAAADATISLPEVKLGILPGFGGTQRLPRLISIEKALDLILSGRSVDGKEAARIGLVDRLAPPDGLLDGAIVLAREAALDRRHLQADRAERRGGVRALLLEKNPLGRSILFKKARETTVRKTGGHYPAPLAALDVIRQGLSLPLKDGLALEARELGRLSVTSECKNLIHVFNLSQRPKRGPGVAAEPGAVRRAGVLGAGVMGGGIAQLLAARGISVLLKDIRQEAVQDGLNHARELFRRHLEKKGRLDELESKMSLLQGTVDYDGFADLDLVIEAVVEKMSVKKEVLKETEPRLADGAIFATNTSALSVSELQSVAANPGQVGGMHFFNPVDRMPLVEIVRGDQTGDTTLVTLYQTSQRLGKTPIVVADRPGFLVNRLLVAYLNEACLIAEEGISWQGLDSRALRFGMPMGPFRLIDEVGIDIAAEVGKSLCKAFPYLTESKLLGRALDSGYKGKKGGKGFYLYRGEEKPEANPAVETLLELPPGREPQEAEWRRLLLLMVNEAGRCLEEKVVDEAADVDTGMVFGTGFPPFLGGLCRWADAEGLPKLVEELDGLATWNGPRFTPCEYLKGRKSFYP